MQAAEEMLMIRDGWCAIRVGMSALVKWVGNEAFTEIRPDISEGVWEAKGMKSLRVRMPAVPPTLLIRTVMGRDFKGSRAVWREEAVKVEQSIINWRVWIRG
jgi:hypothetical protein